jgi:hypothetical protein
VELKRYDFDRQARPAVVAGGFHPMYRLQALARAAMLEMGYAPPILTLVGAPN